MRTVQRDLLRTDWLQSQLTRSHSSGTPVNYSSVQFSSCAVNKALLACFLSRPRHTGQRRRQTLTAGIVVFRQPTMSAVRIGPSVWIFNSGTVSTVHSLSSSPSDRAMRLVSSNLAIFHAIVQKLLIRQVLTKPMV